MSRAATFTILSSVLAAVLLLAGLFFVSSTTHAAPNPQINYQGKLTDTSGVAVADGTYNMWFYLYNTTGGATTTNIWEEQLVGGDQVQVTNGLFSVMLGSTSPLTTVDFNQTLYLGVEIGGTGSPTWDGEMSPRKVLGTVPAAFTATELDGIATSSFLRSDQADTIEATESGTLLTLIQNGAGAIFSAINSSAENVFSIFDNGIVAIGTSTVDSLATTTGLAVYNKDVEILPGDPVGVGSIGDGENGADELLGATGVSVVGNYAYVASFDDSGVQILDISDPTNPIGLGSVAVSNAIKIAVRGNYAYVAGFGDNSVQILDISDPTNPVSVGSIIDGNDGADELAGPYGITVSGNYAYVPGYSDAGVQILDISDPTNPIGVGSIADETNGADTLLNPTDIAIAGNYAYVTSYGDDGVQVLDISDPTNPIGVGSVVDDDPGADQLNQAHSITISGNYAYVAAFGDNGVQVIDISDPTNPTGVGSITDNTGNAFTLAIATNITVSGNYAYVASNGNDGIQILDISSSTNPVGVGRIVDGENGADELLGAYHVDIVGNYAYVASRDGNGFQILSLPTLTTPTANIGTLASNDIETDFLRVTQALTADSLNINTNALIGGSLTITGTASSSLQAGNTNPALTITSGYVGIGTTTPYATLGIDGDVALTGGIYDNNSTRGTNGMVLQTTGTGVQWVATSSLGITGGGGGSSLFTDGGDITYLTSLTDVLAIGTTTDISTSTGLAVYNRDIEILLGDSGTPLTAVSSIADGGTGVDELTDARRLVVVGDYAYVTANLGDRVQILDISDPANPVGIGSIGDGENGASELNGTWGIAVQGNYMYVTGWASNGLEIIDISDPTNPVSAGSTRDGFDGVDSLNNPRGLAVSGNYAYVTSRGEDALQIIDISDPTSPIGVGSITDGNNGAVELDEAYDVAVRGNYAYVVGLADDGMQIIDISDPTSPIGVGSVADGDPGATRLNGPESITIAGNFAYIASDPDNGMQIIDISDPTNPVGVGTISEGERGADELVGASGVIVSGDYAYVASDGDNAVQIIDISSSTNPVGAGSISDGDAGADTLAGATALAISGNYLYVAGPSDNGVQILSLPTLTTPTANIGTLASNDIETDFLRVTQSLTADSLNINTNALIGGSLTITGTASSSLQAANTNPALTITSGYVGIGTTTPYATLGIDGDVALTGGIYDNNSTRGTNGMVLQTTGTGVQWVATSSLGITGGGGGSSLFTDGGDITYLTSLTDVLAIGTSTDIATSTGLAVYNRDIEILPGDPVKVGGVGIDAGASTALTVEVVGDYAYVGSVGGTDMFEIFDVSDQTNPTKVGGAATSINVNEISVIGQYAYVVSDSSTDTEVLILDISDKTNPVQIGNADTVNAFSTIYALKIAGKYLYAAVEGFLGDDELIIYDISNPIAPVITGSVDLSASTFATPEGIEVVGNYAYIASNSSTDDFEIVDVSDPTNPIIVGGTALDDGANDLVVSGNYAYVVSSASGDDLEIVDISDPTNPTVVGGADALAGVNNIVLSGNYAYVTNETIGGTDAVEIFDISSSTNPVRISSFDADDDAEDLVIAGNHLYVVSDDTGDDLEIFRLPTLTTPTANIGTLASNDIETNFLRVTQSLTADSLNINTNALIGGSLTITGTASSSLQAANTNPALTITSGYVGIGTTTPYATLGIDGDVALTGGIYDNNSTRGTNGMVLQTTGTGVQWVATSSLGITGGGGGSSLFTDGGDITYLTSLTDVLAIGTTTDIATSTGLVVYNRDVEVLAGDPVGVGNWKPGISTLEQTRSAAVVGDYAYVIGEESDNLTIVDISDPSAPSLVGDWNPNLSVMNAPHAVEVAGNYAYVTGRSTDNLVIVDISNPTRPTTTGNWDPGIGTLDQTLGLDVAGNYAYVIGGTTDNLLIVDISDPTNPTGVGEWRPGSGFMDEPIYVKVVGNYAYVTGGTTNNLAIVDISDPTNPVAAGYWDPGTSFIEEIRQVAIHNNRAYVTGTLTDNLAIVDISDPTNPTTTAYWNPMDETILDFPVSVSVTGNYAYISGFLSNNVAVLDISSSTNPVRVGEWQPGTGTLQGPDKVTISGGYGYVAGYTSDNLAIFRLPTLTTPTANIGTLASNQIETNFMRVTQALIADSLNINTNAMVGGTMTITGTASSSLIASNSNVALTITSGFLNIGTSTNATSGIQIGYGAICVDNDGACEATTTGRISSVSTYTGNSDLAETYFSADPLEPGDIVQLEGELSISRANKEEANTIIGVVSTKPGVLLGFDDVSTRDGESQYPIALKGRIPVKISTENGPVTAGDQLMLSSIPGTAMKAAGTGTVVGIALEDFNPVTTDTYYSDTFINQYTDDLSSSEDKEAIIEELTDKPLETALIKATTTGRNQPAEREVQTGQIVMFVDLSYRYLDANYLTSLNALMGTTTKQYQGDDEDETLFERLTTLARSFVDGVLSIFSLEADKVEVAEELCISSTCIQADDLQVLINSLESEPIMIDDTEDNDPNDPPVDVTPPTSTTTSSSTASSTDPVDSGTDTASSTASSTSATETSDTNATSTDSEVADTGNTSTSSEPVIEDKEVVDEPATNDLLIEEEPPAEPEQTTEPEESEPEPEDLPAEEESAPEPTPPPEPEPEPPVEEVSGDGGDT